ncbi:sensor histidine kinase [Altericista sp. CCNU0014]|uniref:sensor histidine kinase n=1 Tax=Altericista sp. CCNU0014 TaxID=3082949 RepID=UPI00384BD0E0
MVAISDWIWEFGGGLATGLGLWGWSSWRWQRQLSRMVRLFPTESYSTTMPLQVRLLKAVQFQQRSELSLHQRLNAWQTILQAAPIGYLEVDAENYVYWHNAKAAALLNIEPRRYGSVLKRSLLQMVRSYELDRLIESIRQHQTPQCQEWTFHSIQSSPAKDLPLRGSGFPLEGGNVGVFLEDRWEAVQLAEERDRWTSDVAHELKTPLTSIRLIAETLQRSIDPSLRSWVDRLIQETVRLSVLVQDILELSQIAFQNPNALNPIEVDVPKLIQNAWITLEPLAQAKNLSLYYEGPDRHLLRADGNRLLRVFLNLIDNSIKFSPVDAAIAIYLRPNVQIPLATDAEATEEWTQIEILDAGTGFPEDSLSHVFKRFYRADPARGRATEVPEHLPTGGGSGLGLAIAHQIVTAHGGTISAQNHPTRGGAWIRISLPVNRLKISSPAPPAGPDRLE